MISSGPKKHLLLIYPSQLFAPDWGNLTYTNPPLVNLFSYLSQYKNINIQILDLDIEIGKPRTMKEVLEFKEKATRIIGEYKFDIAGISCSYSINYLSSIMVAEICRNINGNCTIAVGGMHASAVPDDFTYEGSPFDFVVIGEGEEALLRICQNRIRKDAKARKIIGKIIDLNNLPAPRFKEYRYFHPTEYHTVLYALSRGCSFSCSFCIESAKSGTNYRCLPIKRTLSEIQKMIYSLGIKKIKFADPCFGLSKEWRREFLKSLIKKKIKTILELEIRIDLLEKEDVDLFSKLNIGYLFLGLEHASPRMLFLMQKTNHPWIYLEKARKIIKYINEKDIPNKLLLVFNHPGETKDSVRETIQFLDSIFSKLKRISTILSPKNYFLTPGTKTYHSIKEYREKYGTIIRHKMWWREPRFDHQDLATDIFPSKDLNGECVREFWKKGIQDIQKICISRRSRNYLAFDIASRVLLGDKDSI